MKTKYSSNRELIHIWANNDDSSVYKSANSVSCHHDVLFSYSTAIGEIFNNTVIFNTASYSNTTSKHQTLMRYSANHYEDQIYLNIPKYNLNRLVFGQYDFENQILETNNRLASELLVKASRSKLYKDRYTLEAISIFNNLEKYALLLNLKYEKPNLEAYIELSIQADKKAKEFAKYAKAQRIKQQAEALQDWRNGLDIRNHFEITALRIKDDNIETSKGAKIPLDHAIKFWSLIKSWHEDKKTYIKTNHSIHLGNYSVNRFENDILTIGCHSIPYSEIQNIANQLNLN